MPRKRALKLEVTDGIREVRLGAYRKTGNKAETEWHGRNRLGTEPYARWCGRTAGATPPPTRLHLGFPAILRRLGMKKKKRNYYKLLNVDRDASPSEIKKAYRKAVKRYHPDVAARNDEKFKQIQEAYETLSDPTKKMVYDQEAVLPRRSPLKMREPSAEGDFLFSFFDEPDLFRSIDN